MLQGSGLSLDELEEKVSKVIEAHGELPLAGSLRPTAARQGQAAIGLRR